MPRPKPSEWLIHILAWIIFLALPLVFIHAGPAKLSLGRLFGSPWFWLFPAVYIAIYYFHYQILLPRLFLQKKYVAYAAALLLIFILLALLKPFDHLNELSVKAGGMPINNPGPPPFWDKGPSGPLPPLPGQSGPPVPKAGPAVDIVSLFLGIVVLALGMAGRLSAQWKQTRLLLSETENEKLSAELSFLKAQINPHFLFNTLNNIYSLAVTKNEKTAESIMRLSNIMRYITDDAMVDFVPLQEEVACINDYIELQRLRLTGKTHIDFSIIGSTEDRQIAPLLLMTFVENVFKYGVSNHEESAILISLLCEEGTITFNTRNKVFNKGDGLVRQGVGVANAQKRMAHLYPGRHALQVNEKDNIYTVTLVIKETDKS